MHNEPPSQESAQSDDSSQQPVVQITLLPEFRRNLRKLIKRYRNIRSDIQSTIEEIQAGNFVGDPIAGIGEGYAIHKVRVRNRDIQKGKSAGYRLIYQIESPTSALLLTIYSKSDQDDIGASQIRDILQDFYETEDEV